MAKAPPLSVYIHWPYCSRICPYCDFNIYKGAENASLVDAIINDLASWRKKTGPRTINSIHFGGGTPSLMRSADVGAIVDTVNELWGLPRGTEIGLEANPSDFNQNKWSGYGEVGINRLSLGVQSFDDSALKFLGRNHDGETAKFVTEQALKIFANVSIDLIYGLYGQDADEDKRLATELGVRHISTYQLTIEEGTAFHRAEQRGQKKAVDNDESANAFDLLKSHLQSCGFERYEISNWAVPGFESRHNLAYWLGFDYVGVGPGAHGRLTAGTQYLATIAHMQPDSYIKSVDENETGLDQVEILSKEEKAAEYVMMGLRISKGISKSRYQSISGQVLPESRVKPLLDEGFLQTENDQLYVTEKGRDVLDHITGQLLA